MIDPRKLGMSDLSTVVGLNPFDHPVQLAERIKTGAVKESTLPMRFGTFAEPFVLSEWERVTGGRSKGPRNLVIPGKPFLRANLDADAEVDSAPAVVDAKTSGWHMLHAWGPGQDDVPPWVMTQMQGYLWATGYPRCDVAAFLGGAELRIYTIRPDVELQQMLIDAACRFWRDHIEGNKPVPVDGSQAYADFLAGRYPEHRAPMMPATQEVERLALELRVASELADRHAEEAAQARNRLRALLGDAEGVEGSFGRIIWKTNKDSTKTDWEAVARDLGAPADVITRHTTTKPGPRVFRPSWAKEQP